MTKKFCILTVLMVTQIYTFVNSIPKKEGKKERKREGRTEEGGREEERRDGKEGGQADRKRELVKSKQVLWFN